MAMVRLFCVVTGVAAMAAAAGCAQSGTAYPFRGPQVSAVRAAALPERPPPAPAAATRVSFGTSAAARPSVTDDRRPAEPVAIDRLPAPHRTGEPNKAPAPAPQPSAPIATRPAPTADPDSAVSDLIAPATGGLAGTLRSLVGQRHKDMSRAEFAIVALSAVGVAVADPVRAATSGAALLDQVERRDARGERPLPGDLVVFAGEDARDGADDERAHLFGVIAAIHDRSPGADTAASRRGRTLRTVEFIYLERGVARHRRGSDRARPGS
ncbi:MAG: hypothetical protein AAGC55_02095 [Myxococcota bacterium]